MHTTHFTLYSGGKIAYFVRQNVAKKIVSFRGSVSLDLLQFKKKITSRAEKKSNLSKFLRPASRCRRSKKVFTSPPPVSQRDEISHEK